MKTVDFYFREISEGELSKNLCQELKEFLVENRDEFAKELVGDLSHIDNRAESFLGAEVQEVHFNGGNEFTLVYSYEYNIYNGCADMEVEGDREEETMFTISEDGTISLHILEITNHYSARIYED
jgi:hypothetical protein